MEQKKYTFFITLEHRSEWKENAGAHFVD